MNPVEIKRAAERFNATLEENTSIYRSLVDTVPGTKNDDELINFILKKSGVPEQKIAKLGSYHRWKLATRIQDKAAQLEKKAKAMAQTKYHTTVNDIAGIVRKIRAMGIAEFDSLKEIIDIDAFFSKLGINTTLMKDDEKKRLILRLREENRKQAQAGVSDNLSEKLFDALAERELNKQSVITEDEISTDAYSGDLKSSSALGGELKFPQKKFGFDPLGRKTTAEDFKDFLKEREQGQIDYGPVFEADIEEVSQRIRKGLVMEKPQGSSFHHFLDYLKETRGHEENIDGYLKHISENFKIFIVEHNWSEAFKGATDFNEGEFNFPFEYNCFEFRLSGLRLLFLFGIEDDGKMTGILATGINHRWYVNADRFVYVNGKIESANYGKLDEAGDDMSLSATFVNLLGDQIRAVCIMLESEIAETSVVRASYKLSEARIKKGKVPLKDFHIVNLARRHRVERCDTPGSEGTRKRLHFRRGHWRHFSNGTKTLVKWCLVGDPDLGFVDKHYRL